MMHLNLDTAGGAYTIYISSNAIEQAPWRDILGSGRVAIISNPTVAGLCLERLTAALPVAAEYFQIADGEAHKNLATYEQLVDAMLAAGLGRDSQIIALGGGVVGDIAGFVAATYQRGIPFVQVPTTLLAQVDSSVGGKTAVNCRAGKNMIGAFHQPRAVVMDTSTLASLPMRELRAGYAEIVKYGLLGDSDFLRWLEQHGDAVLRLDPEHLTEAIHRSCRAKADIVARDERESGCRALLNLGHTFGHAIEAMLGYGQWLHGEAVALGMLMAADLSQRTGHLDGADVDRVRDLLRAAGLPCRMPSGQNAEKMLGLMRGDKKTRGGKMRLVLFDKLGRARLAKDVQEDLIMATLRHFCDS